MGLEFLRYVHLERFGNDEVRGIEFGECWIFPKLDGTNGSVWLDSHDRIRAGSRNRSLPAELSNGSIEHFRSPEEIRASDNQGFAEYIGTNSAQYRDYFRKYPNQRLYGEWLVPHAFQGYRRDAWKRFYIFDVSRAEGSSADDSEHFVPFNIYEEGLKEFGLDYVIPQCRIVNPQYEALLHELKQNTFLCEDGKGPGEGIVIKNYGFYNKYKRQVWAKLISNEFKEQHTKHHGVAEKTFGKSTEESIVALFVTDALIEKEYYKIVNECNGWSSKYIPRLFHMIFHALVTEEIWNIMRKFGDRITINFGALYALTVQRIKEVKKELF